MGVPLANCKNTQAANQPNKKKSKHYQTSDEAQLVECFLCSYEALSSSLEPCQPGIMVHAPNSSTQWVESGESKRANLRPVWAI